ncbi:MAG: MCE family protein [Deltaproteobacteria bacterium]|nr:MCE family protein [Deltaproteobacteria bacterium]MBW2173103.1 MCE family protein [Deltaproteobacteria bacterium]MBW2565323.1 MCE family protein [Deltaproteobacteria bacterium]
MEISFDAKEKIVGTFMVIMVILLLTVVVMIGRGKDWFKAYVTYYTVFDEAYNLGENARVKLFKADIGKVESVRLEGDKVKVELAIFEDHATRIKMDSVATVESPTFIGSEYVSIKPGSTGALPIPENGTIPSKAKKSLADFLTEFEIEKTGKMIIKSLQNISEIVADLRDPEGPLYTSLDSLAKTLVHLEEVIHEIKDGTSSVDGLIQSEGLIERIYEELNNVNRILGNLEDATAKTPDIMNEVKKSMDMITRILTNIEKGSHDVPAVTKTTKHGIREIRDGVEEVDKVVQSVQESFLIKPNLPPEPKGEDIDTGLRR